MRVPLAIVIALFLSGAAATLDQQAAHLFQAKRFDEACPLFRQLAEKRKTGAAWSDLGLCELTRQHLPEGRLATLATFHLAEESDRRHAAYNWDRWGVHPMLGHDLPKEATNRQRFEECRWLTVEAEEAALGCESGMWACFASSSVQPAGGEPACGLVTSSVAVLGTSPASLEEARRRVDAGTLFAWPEQASCEDLVDLPGPERRLPGAVYLQLEDRREASPVFGGDNHLAITDVLIVDPCRRRIAVRIQDDRAERRAVREERLLPDEPAAPALDAGDAQ